MERKNAMTKASDTCPLCNSPPISVGGAPSRCSNPECMLPMRLWPQIAEMREQLATAGDGDTWREVCKRLEAEIERLKG
jgi:hypothetical protein